MNTKYLKLNSDNAFHRVIYAKSCYGIYEARISIASLCKQHKLHGYMISLTYFASYEANIYPTGNIISLPYMYILIPKDIYQYWCQFIIPMYKGDNINFRAQI